MKIMQARMSGECPAGQWAPLDYCTPMPPEMILETQMRKEERLQMNLECAKEFGLPECLVYRSCPDEMMSDEDWKDRNNKGTLGYKKYRQAKCWEMCASLKQGEKNSRGVPQDIKQLKAIQDQMKNFGCNKYRSGGTNEMVKEALPWMIAGCGNFSINL